MSAAGRAPSAVATGAAAAPPITAACAAWVGCPLKMAAVRMEAAMMTRKQSPLTRKPAVERRRSRPAPCPAAVTHTAPVCSAGRDTATAACTARGVPAVSAAPPTTLAQLCPPGAAGAAAVGGGCAATPIRGRADAPPP